MFETRGLFVRYKEVPGMNYEIRHYDTPLLRFSATEDTARPEIEILWVNDDARQLIPLDLTVSPEGVASWLSHRTIPKNRAYVHNFLSKCGLNINRPMSIVRVSKALSLNDCCGWSRKALRAALKSTISMTTGSAGFCR